MANKIFPEKMHKLPESSRKLCIPGPIMKRRPERPSFSVVMKKIVVSFWDLGRNSSSSERPSFLYPSPLAPFRSIVGL